MRQNKNAHKFFKQSKITKIEEESSFSRKRRPAFRPRPIDIDKEMPVLQEDVGDDELQRNVPEVGTGMEKHEEEELHIQEAIKSFKKKQTLVNDVAIPTPEVKVVEGYDLEEDNFAFPTAYIRYQEPVYKVEYDMEEDDYELLEQMNLNGSLPTEEQFEWIIDRFEITTGFSVRLFLFDIALS